MSSSKQKASMRRAVAGSYATQLPYPLALATIRRRDRLAQLEWGLAEHAAENSLHL
jgi:hypothetical protein